MLEICFGDSERGMIRHAINKSEDEVLNLFHLLDLGHLGFDDLKKVRFEWAKSFFKRSKLAIRFMNFVQFSQVKKVISRVADGEPIRIWTADNATSMCGFYCLVYLLQSVGGQVYRMHLPKVCLSDFWTHGDRDTSWGMISFGYQPIDFDAECVLLNADERKEIADKWTALVKENGTLRVREGNEIVTVPEDYLDKTIEQYEPKGIFTIKGYAGNFIGHAKYFVCDSFIMDRILLMVKQGKYVVVEKSKDSVYDDKLRKA